MRQILVGRTTELDALMVGVGELIDGQGTHTHLVGEAGIGKSALLEFVADELNRRGATIRTAVADETDRRRRLSIASTLLPEVLSRRTRDPIGAAVAEVERLAQRGPLALLADDLHWSDELSLDVLRAIARRVDALGVFLVTAARRHPMPNGLRHLELLARREGSGGLVLDLEPLSSGDLSSLVTGRLGASPSQRLQTLMDTTSGNPFLACELLAGLIDDGDLVDLDGTIDLRADDVIPDRVAAIVVSRILLDIPDGELLVSAMAVLPSGFLPEELALLAGWPRADVLRAVTALLAAGVLVDRSPGLAFRHELLRGAIRSAYSETVLRSLGRHAVDVMIDLNAEPERLATCLLTNLDATEAGAVQKLVDVARSIGSSNPLAAADLLEHTIGAVPTTDPQNLALSVELGWMLVAAGRAAEVPSLVDERFGPITSFTTSIERLVGNALTITGRVNDVQDRFAGIGPREVETLGSATDSEYVDSIAELAQLRVVTGELETAIRLIEWVDDSPTEPTTARVVALATARSYLHGVAGEFEQSIEWGARARRAVADDGSTTVTAVSSTLSMALSLDLSGDGSAALELVRQPDLPGPYVTWAAPLLQFAAAITLYRQGQWDDALTEAHAGLVAAEEVDLGLGVHWPYAVNALIHTARNELNAAEEWLARSRSMNSSRALGTEWLVLATAIAQDARGEVESAAVTLELLIGGIIAAGAPALLLASGPAAVRLARVTGRDAVVEQVIDGLTGLTKASASPVALGIAQWTRGVVAGDWEVITEAADTLERHQRLPDAASARHDAALAALDAGNVAAARQCSELAFRGYDALGADLWHRRCRLDLRDRGLDLRPRRSPQRATHGWEAITTSETAVVKLVAEGLTNTEIAERLFVSRRTVESHLVRIYTKLGVSNRGQLSADAHQRDLFA